MLLIDLQHAIDDPSWGKRNNPDAETLIARLLAHWRTHRWPLIHVRHDSQDSNSPYRPGQPGNDFKPQSAPLTGETVIAKQTNSAFIGTNLETRLRNDGHETLVIAGVVTNNSVEATVRMAGNLGFSTWLVEDACFAFGRPDWTGNWRTAEDVHAMSLANLDGEYCTIISANALLEGSRF